MTRGSWTRWRAGCRSSTRWPSSAEASAPLEDLDARLLWAAKRTGLGDEDIARRLGVARERVRQLRRDLEIVPVFKQVDTCAAEFEAVTSYFYSTYERGEDEAEPSERRSVMILGGGPNRIGQGIEFDYCAVHASLALGEQGWRTIMVNCNPETVSTDYDISDRLYFEPLTYETVMAIIEREQPEGVILQFGGQTPLKLARALKDAGVQVLGTDAEAIDRTEDRRLFNDIVEKLELDQPEADTATALEEAREIAGGLGYPLLVRPSYVLGGQAMVIVNDEGELEAAFERAQPRQRGRPGAHRQVLERRRRGRRRLHQRRGPRGHRRDHGAHRGGRGPLGGLGLCDPAVSPARERAARHPRADAGAGARARGRGV